MLIRCAIFPFVPSPSDRVNQGDWDADRIRGKNLRLSRLHLNWEKVYLNILPSRKRALYDSLSIYFLWLVLLWQVLLSGSQSWIFYGGFYSFVSDISGQGTACVMGQFLIDQRRTGFWGDFIWFPTYSRKIKIFFSHFQRHYLYPKGWVISECWILKQMFSCQDSASLKP